MSSKSLNLISKLALRDIKNSGLRVSNVLATFEKEEFSSPCAFLIYSMMACLTFEITSASMEILKPFCIA